MKKILSIVLLSVVMLSVMIVPSFAASLDEFEQEYGLEGYYTLNLNDPLKFVVTQETSLRTNIFLSAFSGENYVCLVSGDLQIFSSSSFSSLNYYIDLNVVSNLNLDETLLDAPIELRVRLYRSDYLDVDGNMFGPDILENLESSYNILANKYPYVTEYISYDSFVIICTNFANSTQTPVLSEAPALRTFFNANTTFTATNSILELPAPPPPPPIVIEETGNVFTSVISWAGSFVNTVFNNTGLLILFLLGVGISIVLVAIRILRKVMWSK